MLFSKAFEGDFSIGLSTSTFPMEERIKETSLGSFTGGIISLAGPQQTHTLKKENWLRGIHDRRTTMLET